MHAFTEKMPYIQHAGVLAGALQNFLLPAIPGSQTNRNPIFKDFL